MRRLFWIPLVFVVVIVLCVVAFFTFKPFQGDDNTKASANSYSSSASALPVIGSAQETAPVNTTGDPRTPATFAPFSKANQFVTTWSGLDSAVTSASAQWYRDAVNNRTASTGFSWMDIEYWSRDPQLNGVSPLTIQVFGGSWTDAQARAIAAEIVGIDLAAKLPIVHHNSGLLVNTRSIGVHEVGDFLDLRKMVRVSLSPVVYDKDGKVIGLDGNSGIFADCLNIWRLAPPKVTPPKVTPPKVTPPSVTPPRFTPPRFTPPTTQPPRVTPPTTQPPRVTPPTTQPPRVTPPTTQPPRITPPTTQPPRVTPPTTQPPRITPKDPTQDPAPRGNAPVGGGRNQDPGPGTYIPPAQMQQPPTQPRVNPAPPTVQPTRTVTPPPPTGSQPDPTPPPAPEQFAPTPEAPATGTVSVPGM